MKRWVVPVLAVLCLSPSVLAVEPSTHPVGAYAGAIVSADFDNDGTLDVAVAGYEVVSVLLGNGDGTFQSALNSPSVGQDTLAVGDFDQDGNPDLVTSGVVLLGNGDGTFETTFWLYTPYSLGVAVGDLNGDGEADLVGLDYGCGEWGCYGYVMVQTGNGDGTFSSPIYDWDSGSADESRVSLADFDGDGDLDVARGDGVADFNSDDNLDLATVGGGYAVISLGNGDGTFQSAQYLMVNSSGPIAIADFNGDAAPDLAARGYYGIEVRLGNGDGTLGRAVHLDAGFGLASLTAADFDGDGLPDLAASGYDPNVGHDVVLVFMNDGNWPAADAPSITIADATVTEGNSGTRTVALTVSLSAAYSEAITVEYATADGTAIGGDDYQATSGILTIDAGETSGTITVLVNGDRVRESDETFVVNLGGATNAFLFDTQATATIVDDEPHLAITYSVSKAEGDRRQTTLFPFVVTLSSAYDQAVSVSFQVWTGTASTNDFVASAGSLTFSPGQTNKTITVEVKGDEKRESDETFSVRLSAPSSNASLSSPNGFGTILNDD